MSETSALQHLASMCFRMLRDDPTTLQASNEEVAAVRQIVGGHFKPQELVQISLKVRSAASMQDRRDELIKHWGKKLGKNDLFDTQDAQAFLDDYFNNPDYPFESGILFNDNIVVSKTRSQRGNFTDRESFFSSNTPCWTLHLTTSGEALVISDKMERPIKQGDMMLFRPSSHYHYGIHPAANDWEHYWVLFQPRSHWGQWLNWAEFDAGIQGLKLNELHYQQLLPLFDKLLELKDSSPPYFNELQYNVLEEILIRAAGFLADENTNSNDRRIDQACAFMLNNLSRPFKVEDVASACNLSPSRLSHLFKDHMGVSMKTWSNNARLQQARKLLIGSNLNISQVAAQVGFDDPNLFAKNFKKNIGCTPREFRQSFAQSDDKNTPAQSA